MKPMKKVKRWADWLFPWLALRQQITSLEKALWDSENQVKYQLDLLSAQQQFILKVEDAKDALDRRMKALGEKRVKRMYDPANGPADR